MTFKFHHYSLLLCWKNKSQFKNFDKANAVVYISLNAVAKGITATKFVAFSSVLMSISPPIL